MTLRLLANYQASMTNEPINIYWPKIWLLSESMKILPHSKGRSIT